MLINTEGRPAVLNAADIDDVLWLHCFGREVILDSKKNRATVTAILSAHNIEAEYAQPLKKKRK